MVVLVYDPSTGRRPYRRLPPGGVGGHASFLDVHRVPDDEGRGLQPVLVPCAAGVREGLNKSSASGSGSKPDRDCRFGRCSPLSFQSKRVRLTDAL